MGGPSVSLGCETYALEAILVAAVVLPAYRSYLQVQDWYPTVSSTVVRRQTFVWCVLSLCLYFSQSLDPFLRRLLVVMMLYPFL